MSKAAWASRNREKISAYRKVRSALSAGVLVRPSHCEECGIQDPKRSDGRSAIQAHHYAGYDQPLTVKWLCPACHAKDSYKAWGESASKSKLTLAQVEEIRSRFVPMATRMTKDGTAKGLAREFGVHQSTVLRIGKGEYWRQAALKEQK